MARRRRTKEREVPIATHSAALAVHKPAKATDHFRHALLGVTAAVLVARPLVPSDGGAWTGEGQIAAALWIALAALWLVQSLGKPRLRVRFGWIDAGMIAFVGWWSVSALIGSAHAAPRPSINMLWEGVAILASFLLLRQLIEPSENDGGRGGGREARALVAVMIAVGACLAITAIYQYFVLMPAYRARFAENPAALFREARIGMASRGTLEFRRFADRLNSPEPTATFDLTNSLAAYLAPWLVVSLGIAMFGAGVWQSQWRRSRIWLFAIVVASPIAIALALTHSRSACIGAGVGLVCLAVWRRSAQRRVDRTSPTFEGRRVFSGRMIAVIALAVAIVGGIAIALRPQMLQPAAHSFQVRLDYWRASCAMIADRPWWGVGPGNFGDYYTQYKLPAATEEIKDPHNFALEIATSAGLPALILFLAVLAGAASRLRRRITLSASDEIPGELTDSPQSTDGTWWILGGALLGFWLAFGWNTFIAGFPAWEEETVVRMAAAGITWWLLWPWMRHGTLPPRLCGIGVLVLLVALLAVGGMTFGGVNETLWLLLALGLNATDQAGQKKTLPWIVNFLLLAVVVALCIEQRQTAYQPMLASEKALDAAREVGASRDPEHRDEQQRQLLAAVDADPYAVEPCLLMAAFRLADWRQGDKRAIGDFEAWMNQALALEPQSATLLAQAATAWQSVFETTKLPADGRKVVELYLRAVQLYPTGVVLHLELARALSETGDSTSAIAAAREALRLDDLRLASERALNVEQRQLAKRIISGDNQVDTQQPAVPLGPPSPAAPGISR